MPQPALPACRALLLSCVLSALSLCTTAAAQSTPESSSVTVQVGDTAYSLARRAGLSVDALLALNGLTAPDLKVGQVLRLQPEPRVHTVQAGETPYAISRRYGVSVDALLAANGLSEGAKIAVGQALTLPTGAVDSGPALARVATAPAAPPTSNLRPAATLAASTPAAAAGDWRAAALAMIGTPYVYGGQSRSGTDCSGFVLQVFGPLGVKLPRVSAEQAQVGLPIEVSALQPGDLVFFDTTGGGRVTHVGIYLGDDQFVNANSYQGKVTVDRLLGDRYWAPRYLGARRVLDPTYALKR